MRGGTASLLTALVLTACRGSGVHAPGPPGIAVEPASLSFGAVSLGENLSVSLRVRATGTAIVPSLAVTTGPFAPDDLGPLPAGGVVDLPVHFRPSCVGGQSGVLTLDCPGCSPVAVSLEGEGQGDPLEVASTFDLGPVPLGGTRTMPLPVANRSCQGTDLKVEFVGDPGNFSLPEVPRSLEATSSASVSVSFQATAAGPARATLRLLADGREIHVQLAAFGGGPSLHADPPTVDLGTWPAGVGDPPWRTLLVTSPPSARPVKVASLEVASGPFLLRADRTLPTDVVGLSLPVRVTLATTTPGSYRGILRIHGVDPAQPDVDVPVLAEVTPVAPCQLEISPSPLEFGLIPAQVVAVREVQLTNVGPQECYTWGYTFFLNGGNSFFMPDLPGEVVKIEPGQTEQLHVLFGRVLGYLAEGAELAFHQAGDPFPVAVEVTGQVGDLVPAVAPDVLDLGPVPVGSRSVGSFVIDEPAAGPVSLGEVGVVGDRHFSFPALPPLPFGMGAGFAEPIHVEFAPDAPGPAWAEVDVYVPPNLEPLRLPVTATATAPCADCAGPSVSCPGPISVHVGELVDRRGAAVAPGEVATCSWSLASWPPGSSAQPAPVSGCLTWFRPDHVGDFTLRLTASAGGVDATCDSQVHASLQGGLQVELTWSAPDDVDLHFFHPLAGSPLDGASWGSKLYDVNGDTGNTEPDWDAPGPADDPFLVRFDAAGTGPEEVTVLSPSGHPYGLGALWASGSHGNASLEVTARIFCDGIPVASTTAQLDQPGEAVYLGDVARSAGRCSFTAVGKTLLPGH